MFNGVKLDDQKSKKNSSLYTFWSSSLLLFIMKSSSLLGKLELEQDGYLTVVEVMRFMSCWAEYRWDKVALPCFSSPGYLTA